MELTFPLEALLPEDADESEELCDLFQIKHGGVVQPDDSRGLLVVGAAAAILHQPASRGRKAPLDFQTTGNYLCQHLKHI